MDKNAVLGELIYILAINEKGRVKQGIWTRKYRKSLRLSMDMLKRLCDLLVSEDNIVYLHEDIIEFIKVNLCTIFPSDSSMFEILQSENFALVQSSNEKYSCVNELMINIIDQIITLLGNRSKNHKIKITYLIKALHNLPKVYLNPDTQTIFNIGIMPISSDDALEYSESYLTHLST